MRRFMGALASAAIMLGACGGDDDAEERTPATGSGCEDVTGNYEVRVTPLSGDCPPAAPGNVVNVSISRTGDALNVAIPGIEGGCPAELNPSSCKLTALCKITNSDGSNAALFNYDYTFTGTTFNGTVAGSLSPPVADPACQATARHVGERL